MTTDVGQFALQDTSLFITVRTSFVDWYFVYLDCGLKTLQWHWLLNWMRFSWCLSTVQIFVLDCRYWESLNPRRCTYTVDI